MMPSNPRQTAAAVPPLMIAVVLVWLSGSQAEADVYKVQLASYYREEQAWVGWSELKRSHPALLGDLTPSIERADLGRQSGVFFRLQVGAFANSAKADSLCAQLHSKGLDCIVVFASDGNLNRSEPSASPIATGPANESDTETRDDIGEQPRAPEPLPPARVEGVSTISAYDDGPPPRASETTGDAEDSSEGSGGSAVVNQETPAPPASTREIQTLGNTPTEPAGYVRLLGGLTFAPTTDGLVGAGAGFNVTPTLLIVAEIGRFRDVLSRDIDFDSPTDGGVEIHPAESAVYGMGGLRFLVPTSRYGRPYATVSAGIARLQDETIITVFGRDITADFRVVGALPLFPRIYESLISLGGGVNWETKRGLSFDVGYRYVRIFTVEPIEVGAAYFAVGYAFKKSIDK